MITNAEEIHRAAATNIVEIIKSRLPLKQAGSRFKALCPFHGENSPSFVVTPDKGIWHCFGCQAHGDAVAFIQEMDKLDYPDALRQAAAECGVIPQESAAAKQGSSKGGQSTPSITVLLKACAAAADHFHQQLFNSYGKSAREYLHSRGFTDELIKKYNLGYSCGNRLREALKAFPEAAILEADLLRKPKEESKNQELYDPLRGRITIPLHDPRGQVVGFAARITPENEEKGKKKEAEFRPPKYVNTRETKIYQKSTLLYGLHWARPLLRKVNSAYLLVLEGQLKAIACLEAGYPAVGVGGSAFNPRQAALVNNLSPGKVILAFDADVAGIKAVIKHAPALRDLELTVNVGELEVPEQAELPPGKIDADNLMAARLPVRYEVTPLVKWLLFHVIKHNPPTPDEIQHLSNLILPIVVRHPNPAVAAAEFRQIAEHTRIPVYELKKVKVPPSSAAGFEPVIQAGQSCPVLDHKMNPSRTLCAGILQMNALAFPNLTALQNWLHIIHWHLLSLPLLRSLQQIAKVQEVAFNYQVPVATALRHVNCPREYFSFWLTVDLPPFTPQIIIDLQKEIIAAGVAPDINGRQPATGQTQKPENPAGEKQ